MFFQRATNNGVSSFHHFGSGSYRFQKIAATTVMSLAIFCLIAGLVADSVLCSFLPILLDQTCYCHRQRDDAKR